MELDTLKTEKVCPREEICLYLDGELSPNEVILLEKHLAECQPCLNELNLQKQMLLALSAAFDKKKEIELPKNFTNIVVAKAECGVKGLRNREERYRAFLLFLPLLLIFIVGLGGDKDKFFSLVNSFGIQILTVGGFLVHLTFDISFGIAVILKTISQKIVVSQSFTVLLFASLILMIMLISPRFYYKFYRAKTS